MFVRRRGNFTNSLIVEVCSEFLLDLSCREDTPEEREGEKTSNLAAAVYQVR